VAVSIARQAASLCSPSAFTWTPLYTSDTLRANECPPQLAAGCLTPKPKNLRTAQAGCLGDGVSYTSVRCLAAAPGKFESKSGLDHGIGHFRPLSITRQRQASITASATLESALWTSRRRWQIDRVQNCRKHSAWFLTKKPFCRCRSVRARQKKVVNRGETNPLTRQIKPSKLVVA